MCCMFAAHRKSRQSMVSSILEKASEKMVSRGQSVRVFDICCVTSCIAYKEEK